MAADDAEMEPQYQWKHLFAKLTSGKSVECERKSICYDRKKW